MLGVFPLAAEPLARGYPPVPVPSAFETLIAAADAEGQYLVEIDAFIGGETRSGGLWTVAEGPLASIPPGGGVGGNQVTLRYADRHWIGAPPDLDKPNVHYEGRVDRPLDFERSMPLLPEEERRGTRQFGAVEIANGDGALDTIIRSYAVAGRRVRVRFGPYMGAYRDFGTVADVLATGWEGDDRLALLGLRDRSFALERPLQDNLYAGTGGAEGTTENEGKPVPLLFGRARNITPVLIDPVNLIYQFHDGAAFALDDVFDRAGELTDSGDDAADYTALAALSVAGGQFATAKAAGLMKLGALPDGLVTCDVRGDATPDYADTLDRIALRVLRDRHGLAGSFVNSASFAGAAALGGEMGFYISSDERPSTAEVLGRLLGSAAGWWGTGRDGQIRAGRLTRPEIRTPNLYLDTFNVLSLEPEEASVPRWRQTVGYRPNWTEQRGEDLAASVTAARRQFLTESARTVPADDGAILERHPCALDAGPLETLYEAASSAQAIADDQMALHGPDRRIFRARVKRLGFKIDLQATAHLIWPRFGLSGGQNFAVLVIREDGDEQTLRLWG